MNKIQKRNAIGFCIYLLIIFIIFYITNFVYPKCLVGEGYSGDHVAPEISEIIKPLLFLIPIILSFCVTTILYFVLKFKRFNKFVLPIIVVNASILVFWFGVTLYGATFGWLLFLIIPVSFILFVLGIVFGWILDNKQKNIT